MFPRSRSLHTTGSQLRVSNRLRSTEHPNAPQRLPVSGNKHRLFFWLMDQRVDSHGSSQRRVWTLHPHFIWKRNFNRRFQKCKVTVRLKTEPACLNGSSQESGLPSRGEHASRGGDGKASPTHAGT